MSEMLYTPVGTAPPEALMLAPPPVATNVCARSKVQISSVSLMTSTPPHWVFGKTGSKAVTPVDPKAACEFQALSVRRTRASATAALAVAPDVGMVAAQVGIVEKPTP